MDYSNNIDNDFKALAAIVCSWKNHAMIIFRLGCSIYASRCPIHCRL